MADFLAIFSSAPVSRSVAGQPSRKDGEELSKQPQLVLEAFFVGVIVPETPCLLGLQFQQCPAEMRQL